jgi:hypothetical protein
MSKSSHEINAAATEKELKRARWGGEEKKKQVIRASGRESDTGFDALPVVNVSQRAAVCRV